jgi:hypothetical protein
VYAHDDQPMPVVSRERSQAITELVAEPAMVQGSRFANDRAAKNVRAGNVLKPCLQKDIIS